MWRNIGCQPAPVLRSRGRAGDTLPLSQKPKPQNWRHEAGAHTQEAGYQPAKEAEIIIRQCLTRRAWCRLSSPPRSRVASRRIAPGASAAAMCRTGSDASGELSGMAAGEKLNDAKFRQGEVGDSNERRSRTGKCRRGRVGGRFSFLPSEEGLKKGRAGDCGRARSLRMPRCAAPQGATEVILSEKNMPNRVFPTSWLEWWRRGERWRVV